MAKYKMAFTPQLPHILHCTVLSQVAIRRKMQIAAELLNTGGTVSGAMDD